MRNDEQLIQGETVFALSAYELPIGACAIGYAGWKGLGLRSGARILEFFLALDDAIRKDCHGNVLGAFVSWFDSMPRGECFPQLLYEVELALAQRTGREAERVEEQELCEAGTINGGF